MVFLLKLAQSCNVIQSLLTKAEEQAFLDTADGKLGGPGPRLESNLAKGYRKL